MSRIICAGAFADTSLPVDGDLKSILLSDARLTDWWQADSQSATESGGAIVAFLNLVSGRGALNLLGGSGNIPALETNADFAGYQVANFKVASGSRRYAFSQYPGAPADFSYVWFGTVAPSATNQKLWYIEGATVGVGPLFAQITANASGNLAVSSFIGSPAGGLTLVNPATEIKTEQRALIIVSASGGTLRARYNSGAVQSVARGPFTAGANAWLGAKDNALEPFRAGVFSDFLRLDVDALAAGNEDLLALIDGYFAGTY